MKAHLSIVDDEKVGLDTMIGIVDGTAEILNRHVVVDNAIRIASETEAKALARKFSAMIPDGRYLIRRCGRIGKEGG